ncbi:MAG: hypothetical protein M1826_000823 [Phylliscum demangeonii]|nr:MAG: hypothetical protein M1826_000823 [Phylliscum demangeonii]
MADSEISLMWEEAVSQYNETTGVNLLDADFPKPESADDLLTLVDKRQSNFSKFRHKRGKIFAALKGALKPVQLLGKLAADGASTAFPPSSMIFGAVNYLIEVAKDVSAHYDTIIKLFAAVKEFTCRLRVHQQQKIDPELQKIVTKILITLMDICAISTKSIKRGRVLKYAKDFFLGRDPAVQDALDRLKSLTENEDKMVGALILAQTGKIGKEIRSSADQGRREKIIRWLKAPDPNTRHYAECKRHQPDTGRWLIDDNKAYRSWKLEPASFLWLHGNAEGFSQTYIIVDALDECSDWDELLDVMQEIVEWKMSSLHLLVTSRKEKKIEDRFHALQPVLIPLQSRQVDGDIRLYR